MIVSSNFITNPSGDDGLSGWTVVGTVTVNGGFVFTSNSSISQQCDIDPLPDPLPDKFRITAVFENASTQSRTVANFNKNISATLYYESGLIEYLEVPLRIDITTTDHMSLTWYHVHGEIDIADTTTETIDHIVVKVSCSTITEGVTVKEIHLVSLTDDLTSMLETFYEEAIQTSLYAGELSKLNELAAKAQGYYVTYDIDPLDQSIIYYQHDEPNIVDSMLIYKMSANGFFWTDQGWDGEETVWTSGYTAEGNIVAKTLSVIGLIADWIKAGIIKSIDEDTYFDLDNAIIAAVGNSNGLKISSGEISFYDDEDLTTLSGTLSNLNASGVLGPYIVIPYAGNHFGIYHHNGGSPGINHFALRCTWPEYADGQYDAVIEMQGSSITFNGLPLGLGNGVEFYDYPAGSFSGFDQVTWKYTNFDVPVALIEHLTWVVAHDQGVGNNNRCGWIGSQYAVEGAVVKFVAYTLDTGDTPLEIWASPTSAPDGIYTLGYIASNQTKEWMWNGTAFVECTDTASSYTLTKEAVEDVLTGEIDSHYHTIDKEDIEDVLTGEIDSHYHLPTVSTADVSYYVGYASVKSGTVSISGTTITGTSTSFTTDFSVDQIIGFCSDSDNIAYRCKVDTITSNTVMDITLAPLSSTQTDINTNFNKLCAFMTGDDDNDGTAPDAAHALATIGKAITLLPSVINDSVNIYLVDASFSSESVTLKGYSGTGYLNVATYDVDYFADEYGVTNESAPELDIFTALDCSVYLEVFGIKTLNSFTLSNVRNSLLIALYPSDYTIEDSFCTIECSYLPNTTDVSKRSFVSIWGFGSDCSSSSIEVDASSKIRFDDDAFSDYPAVVVANSDSIVVNPDYGATTVRPVYAVTGTRFFDTTLGYAIWFNGTDWVDAAGTVV